MDKPRVGEMPKGYGEGVLFTSPLMSVLILDLMGVVQTAGLPLGGGAGCDDGPDGLEKAGEEGHRVTYHALKHPIKPPFREARVGGPVFR
jgi:hypothetical protein